MPKETNKSSDQKPHASDAVLERIEEARRDPAKLLKLSSFGLTELPDALFELTALQALDLSHNRLTRLPESLGNLTQLKFLHLHVNQLVDLPEALARLTQLESLSLTLNDLKVLPDFICELVHLQELYLVSDGLSELPSEIGRLVELEILILADNQLTSLPKSIGNLSRLQRLDLKNNQLRVLPESFASLAQLEILELHNNKLVSLPAGFGRLENLRTLSLYRNDLRGLPSSISGLRLQSLEPYDNQLSGLPKSLGEMFQLQHLDLHGNRLRSLPASIGKLKQLRSIDLHSNKLSVLPKSIGGLSRLEKLNLQLNQLSELPESIGELAQLQVLNVPNNRLAALPESIDKLERLWMIDVHDNQLTKLPESFCRLTTLRILDARGNKLTELPAAIGQLTRLELLELDRNQLSALPESIGRLTALQRLFLSENRLTTLPRSIRNLRSLIGLSLDKNDALNLPAELLGKVDEILEYFFKLESGSEPLNEAKLILVGRGAAGKTSIVNRLINDTFRQERKTEGIKITEWKLLLNETEDVRLHIWDFGGQEIMHATHQFFFTQRSLYLLVLNGREGGEDADAEYWLKLIESFGGESPVIIVLNKIKEHAFDVNRRALQQKYPSIRAFVRTDCKHRTGIDELDQAIRVETDRLEHLRDPFPASWFDVKNRLAGMRKNFLSFEEYRKQCARFGEKDPKAQESLAFYLNSLGIALNYRDDPRLQDTHVLNPRWVTNGIYKLLNSDKLEQQKGEIRLGDLSSILDGKQYPIKMHRFLFDLMRKFDLCFSFPDDDTHYLIPELLDKQEPLEASEFKVEECLNFQYHYPVLPEGLLPRFIVRTHALSEGLPRWRTGVIVQLEGCQGLVKADVQDKKVFISVNGPMLSRRRLLAVIRSDIERINRDISNLEPLEMVPLPNYPNVVVPYEKLIAMEWRGFAKFPEFVGSAVIDVEVSALLNGLEPKHANSSWRPREQATLFISYSHKDEGLRSELDSHLKILQRSGWIDVWHDRRIAPGDDWKKKIDNKLEHAQIVLLLLSPDFIASDYCFEVEMKKALERHKKGEAIVIPVILRPCNWQRAEFAKLQALPKDGLPVTLWPDKDSAWLNVEEGIERVVEELRKQTGAG